jgi:hypothetical protein
METASRHVFYERTRREKVAEGQSAVPSLRPPGLRLWHACATRLTMNTAKTRISGDYKRTSLFLPHSGAPVVAPKVLGQSERTALMNIL